jgi:hypothetical protein
LIDFGLNIGFSAEAKATEQRDESTRARGRTELLNVEAVKAKKKSKIKKKLVLKILKGK